MQTLTARFSISQVIHHKLFDYRGVIIDVDPCFQGTDEWYEKVALSRPAREKPWYHILVHGAIHRTYAAEANLELDHTQEPIQHPELNDYFGEFVQGTYITKRIKN